MKIYQKVIFLFILIFSLGISHAQNDDDLEQEKYHLRQFDKNVLENYKKNKDFQYDRKIVPPDPSVLQKFIEWLKDALKLSTDTEDKRNTWSYFFYTISILTLLYLILRLVGVDVTGIAYRRSKKSKVPFGEFIENINELNFDKLIKEAIEQKMFEQAIRLFYLRTLKNLSDKKIIQWEKDKTNRDYVRELRQSKFVNDFKDLTFIFEYVCYGNFTISDKEFKEAKEDFDKFNNLLTKERKANAV